VARSVVEWSDVGRRGEERRGEERRGVERRGEERRGEENRGGEEPKAYSMPCGQQAGFSLTTIFMLCNCPPLRAKGFLNASI
jgi:hypothetical protein